MLDRPSLSEQFAVNIREAQAAARDIAASVDSIDRLVVQTRQMIAESRRVLAHADKLVGSHRAEPGPGRS